jgi:hypothetical protein
MTPHASHTSHKPKTYDLAAGASTSTEPPQDPKPEADGAKTPPAVDLKALFEKAESFEATIADKERELKEAQAGKSLAVKAIFEATGKKGPFKWKGRQITITCRTPKDKPNQESWYFREPNSRDAIDIE